MIVNVKRRVMVKQFDIYSPLTSRDPRNLASLFFLGKLSKRVYLPREIELNSFAEGSKTEENRKNKISN